MNPKHCVKALYRAGDATSSEATGEMLPGTMNWITQTSAMLPHQSLLFSLSPITLFLLTLFSTSFHTFFHFAFALDSCKQWESTIDNVSAAPDSAGAIILTCQSCSSNDSFAELVCSLLRTRTVGEGGEKNPPETVFQRCSRAC